MTLMIYKKKKRTKIYTAKTTQRHKKGFPLEKSTSHWKHEKRTKKAFDDLAFAMPANASPSNHLDIVQHCTSIRQGGWDVNLSRQHFALDFLSHLIISPTSTFSFFLSSLLTQQPTSNIDQLGNDRKNDTRWQLNQCQTELVVPKPSMSVGDLQSRRHSSIFLFLFSTDRILVTLWNNSSIIDIIHRTQKTNEWKSDKKTTKKFGVTTIFEKFSHLFLLWNTSNWNPLPQYPDHHIVVLSYDEPCLRSFVFFSMHDDWNGEMPVLNEMTHRWNVHDAAQQRSRKRLPSLQRSVPVWFYLNGCFYLFYVLHQSDVLILRFSSFFTLQFNSDVNLSFYCIPSLTECYGVSF